MKIEVPAPGWTPQERFAQLHRIATRAGSEVAREFTDYVDRDDMTQEALAWLLEHTAVVERSTDEAGVLYEQRLVFETKRYLVPYARRERTWQSGGSQLDDARYTPDAVRLVLPSVWTGDGPERSDSEIRSGTDPSEGNTWLVMRLEVAAALKATVGRADQALLFRHYVVGDSWDAVALEVESTGVAVQKRASRAVASMVDHLNGVSDTPSWGGAGSRKAKSNSLMQHINQSSYYEGDT